MAQRMWFLVEWIDERNVFPTYGIVNVDTPTYDEADMNPGKEILIQIKHGNPRRAQILRVSENKSYLEEHRNLLERQDQKVKNVLQMCMRTIKEMKSDPVYVERENVPQHSSNQAGLPRIINARTIESPYESDSEVNNYNQSFSKASNVDNILVKAPSHNRSLSKNVYKNVTQNYASFKGWPMKSSTPLPRKCVQDKYKLFLDQATQTDVVLLQPPLAKIEEMETILKNVYLRFESLVTQLNLNQELTSFCVSDTDQNNGNHIYKAQPIDESWASSHIKESQPIEKREDVVTKEEIETFIAEPVNSSLAPLEKKEVVASNSRVRRMSAQTTNNIEGATSIDADMVPIGNGNAMVPARLLKEIDWNSHTSATRQLLQAIFSRRVLATHSLTGKQSPAFKNKPPKKILDPKLVDDIVMTVSAECGVPKNLVRNAITIKCTDEAKLYRNRQSYRRARLQNHQNEENVPLLTQSSDESSVVTN
ncbi:hypothetical protein K1T71_009663 [Dendrolimus kikuchii]|uniref:Uncharacterized protein n=1 Tax=Dendrolimus kikuchii TaxID=765133 RepID=A0ACC1CSG2_9NEOP|nr:hypothetical protein K1T71_009663 [Dendrolimus kikuchii]